MNLYQDGCPSQPLIGLLGSPIQLKAPLRMSSERSCDASSDVFFDSRSRRQSSNESSASECDSDSDFDSDDQSFDAGSAHSLSQSVHCFCGRAVGQSMSGCDDEDDDASIIYCSAQCARQDALAALTGGTDSKYAQAPTVAASEGKAAHGRSRSSSTRPSFERITKAGMALQSQLSAPATSHYRRMELACRDSYPSEAIEEAFMTPESTQKPLAAESTIGQRQSLAPTEAQPVLSSPSEQSFSAKHIISLPSSPSIQSDEEEAQERRTAIEKELRDLDAMLKQRLNSLDAKNDDMHWQTVEEEEEDVLACIRSPLLDYEAPLGWRRGTKVYSANFLGLQFNQPSPTLSSESAFSSTNAVDQHTRKVRLEQLQQALDSSLSLSQSDSVCSIAHPLTSSLLGDVHQASAQDALADVNAPSALDFARDLASMQQINWGHEQEHSTWRSPDEAANATGKAISPSDMHVGAPIDEAATLFNRRPSMRKMASFFQRRPSQPMMHTQSASGIGSADLALTPNLITRSAPTRNVALPALLRR